MPEIDELTRSIEKRIKNIGELEDSVRGYINTTRYQNDLLKDSDNWNQICCSLDTIDDTLYSQQDYLSAKYPSSDGLKYVFTYGLLQALFIQQDAMRHLSEAFGIEFQLTDRLEEIRSLRNASIGHPTKNKTKGSTYYNYISRMSLEKHGFTLMRSFDQGNNEFIDIEIYPIIDDQLKDIESSYKILSEKLAEADKVHREKYKDNLLSDIFHSSMSYTISKVAEGIHSPHGSNVTFALSMLNSIQKTYKKFEDALQERGELNDYTKYDLDEYNHALSRLKDYLAGNASDLCDSDARIYYFYIREQHKHFEQIASEVDDEYREKV
ncbi:hypothetical protein QGM61_07640 [Pseudohongiella sp. SYSU M77423]|uniref:hypothetical protein n=1 Tax=Pseudohongiella sp. SYSU M77423 TaxID=3042312 RepID=UPI002480E0C8|nr:hypothetical protein [Pseudohongiella sp. SYSU M77423]MDH7943690.1 hypothetical protein [Pseudohongiella sp. SYSU M77423]